MTSKLQVTLPKAIADQYGIKPGDEITWVSAGESIRVLPHGRKESTPTLASRLRFFDLATARQGTRDVAVEAARGPRGWKREDLYDRGRSR